MERPTSIYQFQFSNVSFQNVLTCLNDLPSRNYIDVLGIDSKLLKRAYKDIACSLATIFNMSLMQTQIPSDWKIARVSPIFKGCGSRKE